MEVSGTQRTRSSACGSCSLVLVPHRMKAHIVSRPLLWRWLSICQPCPETHSSPSLSRSMSLLKPRCWGEPTLNHPLGGAPQDRKGAELGKVGADRGGQGVLCTK